MVKKLVIIAALAVVLAGCTSCKCSSTVQKVEEPTSPSAVEPSETDADTEEIPEADSENVNSDDAGKTEEAAAEVKPEARIADDKKKPSRPLEAKDKVIKQESEHVTIDMHYPEFGVSAMDTALEKIVQTRAKESEIRLNGLASKPGAFDGAVDKYESGMFYEVVRSRSDAADVVLSHTEYTGGAHGSLNIETIMLDGDGNQIDPWSLFKDPDAELEKISEAARAQLREKLSGYDDIDEMMDEVNRKDAECGLSCGVAGYAWPWISNGEPRDTTVRDINIGRGYLWNRTYTDWINSDRLPYEVGCIHTVQGYDLNYVGVIFGPEVTFNKASNRIEVLKENYKDSLGRAVSGDYEALREYILNIYATLMTRGIRGAFVYACDPELQQYLGRYFNT